MTCEWPDWPCQDEGDVQVNFDLLDEDDVVTERDTVQLCQRHAKMLMYLSQGKKLPNWLEPDPHLIFEEGEECVA